MSGCRHSERVQDLLDGLLSGEAAREFRAHLERCPRCAGELAAYRRVFAVLADAPLFDPGPALVERILDRVSPARLRRRWLRRFGIGYAAALALSVAGIGALASQPAVRLAAEGLWAAASRALAQGFVLVLQGLSATVVGLADGWRVLDGVGERLAPLARALAAVVTQSPLGIALAVAALAALGLLWWMRPRDARRGGEARHVGVLVF